MKTTEYQNSVLDLLYPSEEKREQAKARRLRLEKLPQSYQDNLEIQKVASILSPTNQYSTVKLLSELNTDPDIINYRLDAIEDFLTLPKLMPTVYRIITLMLDNDRAGMRKFSNPTSFDEFRAQLDAFGCYITCVDEMHTFYEKTGESLRSAAMKRLFGFFEEIYMSADYQKLCALVAELNESLKTRVKSVTVAINFDDMMTPISAGIVGYSNTEYIEKPSVFDKILYFNAKKNPNRVEGGLFRRYTNDNPYDKDRVINEVDAKLFKGLSKITDGYIKKLTEVLRVYQRIGFEDIPGLQDQLDLYEGVIKLIKTAEFKGVPMCRPTLLPMEERRSEMKNVYDPCLFKAAITSRKDKKGDSLLIRNDISFGKDGRFYILTGANNGGKTTFIRAVGITQILAQAGFYVPCESCEVSPVDFIYTHFPKEEETGIDTSRFTTEIKQFKTISDTVSENSMLLMNESVQSTTPRECVDIAAELVRIFTIIGVRGLFATHLTELAYMCDRFNSDQDCRSKTVSIVAKVNEQTEERIYRIEKGLPEEHSYASTVFKEFGINIEEIRRRKQ